MDCDDPSLTVTESFTGTCSSGEDGDDFSLAGGAACIRRFNIYCCSNNDSAWTDDLIWQLLPSQIQHVLVDMRSNGTSTWRVNGSQVSRSFQELVCHK